LREALEKVEQFKQLAGVSGTEVARASLAFALANPAVSVVIPGARNAAQAEANASAVDFSIADRVVETIRKELGGYNFYLRYAIPV
jgi:aryl-alcohol dehydrogenase-like predicted oxidoreductase